jgi:ferric-dicitrate binding protein FerR (iron transport regulator)
MKIKKPVVLLPNQQATFVNENSDISVKEINNEAGSKTKAKKPAIKETKIPVSKPKLTVNEKVDAEIYTSWKDGKLIFKSERLEKLSLRLERWHDVKIEIKSKALKDKTYTGVFEKETIEQALRALSMSYPFRFEIDQNKITITEN